MTPNHTRQSYLAAALCTALLGLGSVALSTAVLAADNDPPDPAPMAQPVPQSPATPQSAAAPGSSNAPVAFTSGGSPVTSRDSLRTSAWCDPLSNICERHPWTNGAQGE